MNMHNPASGNAPGLSADAQNRLAIFAAATRTTPPAKVMQGTGEDRTFSDELLTYCRETGLSLDWLMYGTTAIPEPVPAKAEPRLIVPGFTPQTHDEVCKERDRLETILTDAEGLVDALQIVLWEFTAVPLESEDARSKRRAINAIGDALERIIRRIDEACD